jgi:hypothetical protein
MSLTPPYPVGAKGRPAAILAVPPEDVWPQPDTLITRRQLAELYGVTVEVIRACRETRKAKALARVRQLESQAIEDEPRVPVQSVSSGWCALAEGDEPFASNVVTRSRPGRYWGS